MNPANTSNTFHATKSILLALAFLMLLAQPLVAQKHSRREKRAKESAALVAGKMDLTEEQAQLLFSALFEKYKSNAATNASHLSKDEKHKQRQENRKTYVAALMAQFSIEDTKKVAKLLKEERSTGKAIFNGKNLNGWNQVNGAASYEVVDGAILGTTAAGSPNSFLATKRQYANFDFRCEVFLMDNELNSGVQFRSALHTEESIKTSKKKKHPIGRVYGYQCEIEASAVGDMDAKKFGDAGYIYDEARRGWLIDDETRLAATTRGTFKNKAWNKMRILANDDHIQTWINGKKICDIKDDMTASGFIALQVHGIGKRDEKWQVKWKNITIKELP